MADYPALSVQSPDVGQTLGTVFGLQAKKLALQQQALDLQRGQQALQTGAYAQQSAQGEAQAAQQAMQERQLLQQTMKSGVDEQGNSILNDQNEVDPKKFTLFATRALPLTGQAVVQNITKTQADKTALASSVADLADKSRDETSGILRSFINQPQANAAEVKSALTTYAKQNPAASQAVLSAMPLVEKLDQTASLKDKNAALIHLAQVFQPAATTAAQQAPNISTVQAAGGVPALQPVQMNPYAPGGIGPTGAPIAQGLAPTQTPGYIRATSAAGQEGAKGASNDEDLYNQVTAAGTKATQIKALTQDVAKLADEVKTGTYTKALANKWAAISQAFGVSPSDTSQTTRRQLLGKYTQQLMLQQEAANGASTDAAQAHVEAAMPDPEHMDPEALKSAARFVGGQADLATSRAQLANAHRQAHGGTSTGLRAIDSTFMQNADPRGFVYKQTPPGPERQAYLKEHFRTPQEIQDFLNKQAVADHLSGR